MGRMRPYVLLGAAVVIALITTLLIYNAVKKKTGVVAPLQETQAIAVATVDLNWGTVVVKEMIRMEEYLKGTLPVGAYTDASSLVGRVVVSSIKAREPFLESRLAPQSVKTGGVAAVISPGKRAVAVKVDKVIGVSGFVHPGNRVDVLVTIARGSNQEPFTKIVLENILVLAAGPEVQTVKGKEQQPAAVDVITLEVTPEEAERLSLSAAQGKVQLALRGVIDTQEVATRGVSIPALLASQSVPPPVLADKGKAAGAAPVRRAVAPVKRVFSVELIQGGKVTTKKFEEVR